MSHNGDPTCHSSLESISTNALLVPTPKQNNNAYTKQEEEATKLPVVHPPVPLGGWYGPDFGAPNPLKDRQQKL